MLEIRPLTLAVLPQLLQIEQTATPYPWTSGVFRSCFTEQYFNFGLFQDEQLLGYYFGQFLGIESQLFNICVAKAAQGQGVGKRLLEHFVAQSASRQAVDAWLEVRAANTVAIYLYQKAGFIETGRRENYYVGPSGREDAILMCLPLSWQN